MGSMTAPPTTDPAPPTGPRAWPRPLLAWRGIQALVADPDDTTAVFQVIGACAGNSVARNWKRMQADPTGRRILAEGRLLLPVLENRARLEQLPAGSLGRHYATFMSAEALTADGLVDASEAGRIQPEAQAPSRSEPGVVLGSRLRDAHDLWHVATGYGRDLVGETALLAFTYAQTGVRGIGVIALFGLYRLWRADVPGAVRTISGGYRRGRRAAFLAAADWEHLLTEPLDRVREQLRIEPAGDYPVVRSDGAPALSRNARA